MKWKSSIISTCTKIRKSGKRYHAVLAAVLCMTAAAPAAGGKLHAEEGPAGYVKRPYTDEWVPAAQAASNLLP